MIPWQCSRCSEDQLAFGPSIPGDRLCNTCVDAERARNAFTETDAGIPKRFQGLTRDKWIFHFDRPWPKAVTNWTGSPSWVALWGPTGTGKTALATVLLAEHLRTGSRGRWISGPQLAWRIQRDFTAVADVLDHLLVTPLLVLDEPLSGSGADWYLERLLLLTRTRDERELPTIVTSQLLPELLETAAAPPPLISRWLSGLRIHRQLLGEDVRLRLKKKAS
jgi:DNA replication protein DnaC